MRRLAAFLPLTFLALSIWHYVDDRDARKGIEEAVERFTIDVRRPFEKEMVGYAPSADMAAQALAVSAIGDALGSTRLTRLSPVERRAWLDVPLQIDDELDVARREMLDAIARNPGWPLHRYFVGKLAYTNDRRSMGTSEVVPGHWLTALESSHRNAPGHDPTTETLAGVTLEAWKILPDETKAAAPEILRAAFRDARFVRTAFEVAVDIVGREVAFAALPDNPASLDTATAVLGRRGDIAGASTLYDRWEAAEWRSRVEDLEEIRTRRARGDWRGLIGAAGAWASRHDVREFDTPEGRREAAELLKLWPHDRIGPWSRDSRAAIVRFFLDGRLDSVDPNILDSTTAALSRAPPPIRARIALAAGKTLRAESIVRAAGNEGSFEWTPYFVDLVRAAIEKSSSDEALDAIGRIAPSARGECDVVVVRREAGEEIDAPDIAVADEDGNVLSEAWSRNGMLGICVDPAIHAARSLMVDLKTDGPSLVEWGLNDGRRDTLSIDGMMRIEVPLSGLTGRNVFYAKVLWGGTIVARNARLD